jgi:hypothetical protein
MPDSQSTIQQRDQQLLAGIDKDLQQIPSLYLNGTTYTPGSLAALIQSRIDAANQVQQAKAAWLGAVKAYQAIHGETVPIVRDLRSWLVAAFGPSAPELADFGFTPAAPAPSPLRPAGVRRMRKPVAHKA